MHQQNINRSLTNNQYVQTRLNESFNLTPQAAHNYVPFLNKSSRFTSNSNNKSSPPIGSYNLPSCFDRKKSPFEDRISHFILQIQKKNEQMCIFKSSLNRFQKAQNHSPGPASYNLFNQLSSPKKQEIQNHDNKPNQLDLARTCPSIPHKSNKYGYSIVNGQMKNIEKSESQIQKEKQFRKNYVETLKGENCLSKESFHKNYHETDDKKKLYQQTAKCLHQDKELELQCKSDLNLLKRPKYEHLYHSKPVPLSNDYKYIGPGQYQIRKDFHATEKKEKYQFFGSTEIRFKQRPDFPTKGYSLLEMVKQNRNLDEVIVKQNKSTYKKKVLEPGSTQEALIQKSPGPGEYNPKIQYSKQSRRTTFFPMEERFKQNAINGEQVDRDQLPQFQRSRSKKSYNTSSLKRDRFKPMHQNYQPVKSEQIYGILSQSNEAVLSRAHKKGGKVLKINIKRGTEGENQEINSWSREQSRKKGGYMKYLKEELAFISYSPHLQEALIKNTNKVQIKNTEEPIIML